MTNKLNIKAVIVDDSPQARKLLRLMLQEFAPEFDIVGEAENGNTGIEAIKKKQADVAFLDIDMPEKQGIELAEELLTQLQNSVVKVTSVKSDKGLIAYEKTISIIPFSNPNLGKASNEHEAIVNFRKNQKVIEKFLNMMMS